MEHSPVENAMWDLTYKLRECQCVHKMKEIVNAMVMLNYGRCVELHTYSAGMSAKNKELMEGNKTLMEENTHLRALLKNEYTLESDERALDALENPPEIPLECDEVLTFV